MRLKIISDGTPVGTEVVDDETGQSLEGIVDLRWHISPGDRAVAHITLEDVPIKAKAVGVLESDNPADTEDEDYEEPSDVDVEAR